MAEGLAWGDIRMVALGGKAGTRPALVLTRTSVIPFLNAVTIAPLTRTIRGVRTEILLGVSEGLKATSAAQFDALQTVAIGTVGRFVGSVGPHRKRELAAALLYAFSLSASDDL